MLSARILTVHMLLVERIGSKIAQQRHLSNDGVSFKSSMIFHHSKNAGKVSVPVLYILSSLQGSVMSYKTYDFSQLGEEKSSFSVLTRKCHLLSIQRSYGPIDSLSTKWAGYSSWDNRWISIPNWALATRRRKPAILQRI